MQVPDTLATIAVPIDDVNPYEHNPRRGDLGAVDRLMKLSEARLRLLSPHPTPAPASVQSTPLAAVTVGALTPTARSA